MPVNKRQHNTKRDNGYGSIGCCGFQIAVHYADGNVDPTCNCVCLSILSCCFDPIIN